MLKPKEHRIVFTLLWCASFGVSACAAYTGYDEHPVALDDLSYSRLASEHWREVVIVETILKDESQKQAKSTDMPGNSEQGDKKFIKPYLLKLSFDKRAMGMRYTLSGTGFVCGREKKKILVCTNAHVVAGGSEITVRMASGNTYSASVLAERKKEEPDFTVLAIESEEPLSLVTLGDSEKVAIGEAVAAIGHPRNFHYSVNHGGVSGRRTLQEDEHIPPRRFFQLDMAVNFGHSGSPLFNMRGEVVGIIAAFWEDSQGIGFAIPANDFKKILEQAKERVKNQQTSAP